jgi:hypothetical protein
VLQATAAVASLAIIMWSLGLPVLQFAEAANVTTLSNTLSDSDPGNPSDHLIYFETPTGVTNGQTITLDFSDGPFVVGSVDFTDIDVQNGATDLTVAADCTGADEIGAAFSGTTLTITFCTGDGASLAPGASTTIEIGLNADGGNAQLTNPTVGSYQIPVTAGVDTGETRVVIVDQVTVTATVDTIFTFTVTGVASGVAIGSDTTGTTTTPTAIAFGELIADTATTAAQNLEVSTNAANGFVVTVTADQQLTSSNGAVIDGYRDGSYDTVPDTWNSPGATPGNPNEAGHWGLTSSDTTLTAGLTDLYTGGTEFVSASSTPVEVFRHDGPADGSGAGVGTAEVLYKIEITALQEAADDYTATLTYVATPVF